MISKRNAHKVYDRNTPVIRKGDPGWTSDNHQQGRFGERYGTNVTSLMDQKIRQRAARDVNMEDLPSVDAFDVGHVEGLVLPNGRDLMCFRIVQHEEVFDASDGEKSIRVRRQWKYCWVQKNGAL